MIEIVSQWVEREFRQIFQGKMRTPQQAGSVCRRISKALGDDFEVDPMRHADGFNINEGRDVPIHGDRVRAVGLRGTATGR